MRTVGLIGGMSWQSTALYYKYMNEAVKQRIGGLHSSKTVIWSFDFHEIEALQSAGDWENATKKLIEAARSLEKAGADCLLICTNTMHKMADDVQVSCNIPLIHIADATAENIKASSSKKPLLLGTRYTMEQDFYKGRLKKDYAINVVIPDDQERTVIHDIIYEELCQGIIKDKSKEKYHRIIQSQIEKGVDGVILGCTEIVLLVKPEQLEIPVFDTTYIHALSAVDFSLG